MEIKRDSERYVRTCDLKLAAFLVSKDQKFSGVYPVGRGQKEISFINDSPELEELIELYKYGDKDDPDLKVEVHKYEHARRELLDLIKAQDY